MFLLFSFSNAKAQESVPIATLTSVPSKGLDILLVIDNSGSMAEEQRYLSGAGIYPLLSHLNGINWNISIITSDSPCLVGPQFNSFSANYVDTYEKQTLVGYMGSSEEKPLAMTQKVIEAISSPSTVGCTLPNLSPKFNDLAVIFVTDENESDVAVGGTNARSLLTAIQNEGYHLYSDVRAYGFIAHPRKSCVLVDQASTEILSVIDTTQGVWADFCSDDYTNELIGFSYDIRKMLAL